MVNLSIRYNRLLTTGLLRWIGNMESDIIAMSEKPDGTKALTALRLLTLYHEAHFPSPTSPSLLYVLAYGGPAVNYREGLPREATVEIRLMKGTQITAPSGPAAIVADAPLLGDIAEALIMELSMLGHGGPGRSVIYKPDATTEDKDFERNCRLTGARIGYMPSLEGTDGKVIEAIAYRLLCTFTLGGY